MDLQENEVTEDNVTGKIEELKDENGETFKVLIQDDFVMPLAKAKMVGRERQEYVKNFPYEDGDILLCSYPKTGTHWTVNLLHFLRHEGPLSEATPCAPHLIDFPLNLGPVTKGARNIVSHLRPSRLPTDHLKPERKIILVFRNPKDAAVSHYHALRKTPAMGDFKLSWNCFIENWVQGKIPVGSYFGYYNSWQKFIEDNPDMDIHVVNFEDLKKHGICELRKLSKYLGLSRTDDQLKAVLDRCSLTNLKADVESGRTVTPLVDKDGKSTLYRKGIIGDWKNMFTVAQHEAIERVIKEEFANTIFKYQI